MAWDAKVLRLDKELSISLDIDGMDKTVPVFLFVPEHDEDHYHIILSKEKAIELRDWLNAYLERTTWE